MGIIFDAVTGFEECARLISTDRNNECFYALILIDTLIDIYSHQYTKHAISDKERSLSIRGWSNKDSPDIVALHRDIKAAETAKNRFEERFKWMKTAGIITYSMSQSILQLHEYRNKYLHRLKEWELDVRAFAKLYFYLFEQLFIAIPMNVFSLSDKDNSEIVKQAWKENSASFSTNEFRKCIIDKVNDKYQISFSTQIFLEILEQFMMGKYNVVIDSMHFIIDTANDPNEAIKELEDRCNTGKVLLEHYGDPDDQQFSCTSTKTQEYLGRIRKMTKATDVHEGLKLFVELSESFSKYEEPIFEFAAEVDEYIQWQIDVIRGK